MRTTQFDEIGEDRQFFDGDGFLDKPAPDPAPLDIRQWKSPGPTITAFMGSTAPVEAIMGPVGGGKTISIFYKHLLNSMRTAPSPIDNVRRYKLTTVRETYRQLNKTTIPSWNKYFPKTVGKWQGGGGEPATHQIQLALPDGTQVEFIHDFIAIGDQSVEDACRGLETTWWFLNEFDRLPEELLYYTRGRTGRYPDPAHGIPTHHGVTVDFNAPNYENHAWKAFVTEKPADWAFFRQPSGLAPNAENTANLPKGYYENQCEGAPDWYIRRMVRNEPGYSREGEPVYGEFNDEIHVAKEILRPDPSLPLLLGGDQGRQPGILIGQQDGLGRMRILDEICGKSMGAQTLASVVTQRLTRDYLPWLESRDRHFLRGWGDPAGGYAGEMNDDDTWLKIMQEMCGFPWLAAPVARNTITTRLEAVRSGLGNTIGGEPALLISPRCVMLRQGFNYGYRYKRLKVANAEEYADTPDKNEFSHIHDALQYLMLGAGEFDVVMGRKRARRGGPTQTSAITEDSPRPAYASGVRQSRAITGD